ncbi:MFS transporter [Paludibacterium purpuratum]|uniref:MFS transporter n=1 Tax=Paludibacterium purpuratum TaxID=1144873 RepID=A0A4R7BAA6_9NEIS|nr:MFS transporter [Paludibacterium purpuratum]TDR80576.1 MFS transporter [Paludibacterium purpuratum]
MPAHPAFASRHSLTIAALVALEYLQTIMVSFASSYISGGIDAAPEEFSLAAAAYATVAVLMILAHRWLVQRVGYRRLLRLSLFTFALGALVCANADSVGVFIVGRMLSATGGSAFFTAARVQVLHHRGPARVPALLAVPVGITLASAAAPWLASILVTETSWRALFWIMLPLTVLVERLVAVTVPQREPVPPPQADKLHPLAVTLLTVGVFSLQFFLERARYDLFDHAETILAGAGLAALLLLGYLWHEWRQPRPLIPYSRFSSLRYWLGMTIYGTGYLVVSGCNVILPIFMVQGLGFALQSTGWVMGLSSLLGLPIVFLHFRLLQRWPNMRGFLRASMLGLAGFAWLAERLSPEATLWHIALALIVLNALFMPFMLGTAAASTFRGIPDSAFSHAYQVKNSMREIANALGISVATIVVQMRTTLHYSRLAEGTTNLSPWYGMANGPADPLGLAHPDMPALAQLAGEIGRQSTLLACQDYFVGLGALALLGLLLLQTKTEKSIG